MADHQAILDEEFEVLESIFPDELEKSGDNEVRIRVEPEEQRVSHPLKLTLIVTYPPTYPDLIPDLALEEIEYDEDEDDEPTGELLEGEEEGILEELRTVAEESLGMAMTFTIATAARDALQNAIERRIARLQAEDDARVKAYEDAEKAKTRGTPLTPELYQKWRVAFTKEMAAKRVKEEEERIRALPAKEREEIRRKLNRASGRQLFETAKVSATSDEALYEEGVEAVDMSKYTREERDAARWGDEEEAKPGVDLADSDDE